MKYSLWELIWNYDEMFNYFFVEFLKVFASIYLFIYLFIFELAIIILVVNGYYLRLFLIYFRINLNVLFKVLQVLHWGHGLILQ